MTQKDFELVARILCTRRGSAIGADAWAKGFRAAHNSLARDFAEEFAGINRRFKRDLFLRQCGVACEERSS